MSRYAILLLFLAQTGYGQITIQETDVQQIFDPGATITILSDTSQYINVGKTGGPNVYDFSSLTFPDSAAYTLYPSSQIPQLAARFNPSSLVWGASPQNIDNSHVFFFTDTSFVELAQVFISPDSQTYLYDSPNREILRLPTTYNLQWATTDGGAGVETTYVNEKVDTVLMVMGWNGARSYNVDGYGTLMVGGKSFQCLRVNQIESASDKSFNYFTKEGLFTVDTYTNQNDTGVVEVSGATFISSSTAATLVLKNEIAPASFSLSQNFPDPFNPSTQIDFSLPQQSNVQLRVYNTLGQLVTTLVNGNLSAGSHSVTFDARNLASGLYIYRLSAGNFTSVKKMLLLK